MDRRRALPRLLNFVLLALLLGAAADHPGLPIREVRWLAPGNVYEGLSREPRECFTPPHNAGERRRAAIGRALFRTPLLLGGQAARAGLSCASCHRNGRGNPHFLFPGLSGAKGTADVTSSLMSRRRGDGSVNPVPIPDLALSRPKVPRDVTSGRLEAFIHGLVVEEFDGNEPPPEVLAGLAAYVRTLVPQGCKAGMRPVSLASRLDEVDGAVRLARDSSGETRRLLLAAARSTLGDIDERFALPALEAERRRLREADRALKALRDGHGDFAGWAKAWPERRRLLLRQEGRSLFNPKRLRALLAAP